MSSVSSWPPPRDGRDGGVPAEPPAPDRTIRTRRPRRIRRLVIGVGWLVVIAVVASVSLVETRIERLGSIPSTGSDVVVLVGSDTRQGLPDDLDGKFGNFAGERADVIILARVTEGTLRLLSLPRDLKVEIAGHGTDKINASYTYGGLGLLASTISDNLGIAVGRAVRVDFGGFASIVDAVGGVELDFEHPTRDRKSGLMVERPGVQRVGGATALAYARSRSTEILENDEWRSTGGNDIQRTARQRQILTGIAAAATRPSMVVRAPGAIAAVADALAVDDDTHSWNLAMFALRVVLAGSTQSSSLPVVGTTEGGVSYVVASGAEAERAVEAFTSG